METPSSPEEQEFRPKHLLHAELKKKLTRHFRQTEEPQWFESFKMCGSQLDCVQWCTNCDTEHPLQHRCSKKWCPLCNWRITEDRQSKIKIWASEIHHPQHVVMTQRNFENISGDKFSEHTRNLQHIRRNKVWAGVNGGITSVECTNKGEGWHIHSHSLIDARWIDEKKLAVEWGKLIGQEFGIIHRKEITSSKYEQEVCKYVCKPSEMVKWKCKDIVNFIESIHGKRFFFAFGSMFKERKKIRAIINASKIQHDFKCKTCEASGCLEFLPDEKMSMPQKIKFMSR